MSRFMTMFWGDEAGATSIEYALIASGIFLVIVTSVGAVGTKLTDVFTQVDGFFP